MKEIDTLLNYSIVKVLEYYGLELPSSTRDRLQMICPFHGDTAPSLLVNVDKNFAHCFGCNQSWDSVEFIRKKEGLGFFDSLKKLSEIAGLNYDTETLRYIYYRHPTAFVNKDVDREEKQYDEMVLNIFAEFLLYCHQWPELFGHFYHYVEWCLDRYDILVGNEQVDKNRLDKVKDWLFLSKKFVDRRVPIVLAYRRLKREEQSERVGEILGIF